MVSVCTSIQETHLNRHHGLDLGPGYIVRRMDRPSHKGGVMSIFSSRLYRYTMGMAALSTPCTVTTVTVSVPYHYIFRWIQILGSVHWIADLDPALFVNDYRDANKNNFFPEVFMLISYCRYIYICLQRQQVTKELKSRFSTFFCILMEVSGSGSRSAQIITDPDP